MEERIVYETEEYKRGYATGYIEGRNSMLEYILQRQALNPSVVVVLKENREKEFLSAKTKLTEEDIIKLKSDLFDSRNIPPFKPEYEIKRE